MKKPISKKILLHPLYIFLLILLITNDWLFKEMFHNLWTGKLSDFAGLFIFPIFFSVLMPKQIKLVHIITAIGFVFWKTGFSQPLVDFIYMQGWQIERVIDYADLIALISIICSYRFIQHYKQNETHSFVISRIPQTSLTYAILIVSFFAFCATSPVRPAMMMGDYNLKQRIDSELTQKEIIEKLETEGYLVKKGMVIRPIDSLGNYSTRRGIFEVDTSDKALNCWHLTNISTKNDTLQVLNILIEEHYNEDKTNVQLLGMYVDSTAGYFNRKEVKKYDKYLKRKILRRVKK